MLGEAGYDVVGQAGNGEQAIELARELRPDLVVMDVKMPVLDGISAAEVIGKERIAPVVMLTAFSQKELVERARDAGVMAYVVKPFTAADLVPAIDIAALALARAARARGGDRRPGRAAGDPQGGRPGQGDPHGAARDHRGRGVPVDPEDGDGPAPRHARGGRGGRHRPAGAHAAATEDRRQAARPGLVTTRTPFACKEVPWATPPGLVFPLIPRSGEDGAVCAASSVASGGVRAFSHQVRRAGRGRCTGPVRLWHQGRRHRLRRRQQQRRSATCQDRLLRRADRRRRQPRHQHPERRQARRRASTTRSTPTARSRSASFDSQGDPTQAPGLAKKAIDDKTIVGIVGPAFSGESKAADPLFNEAGLVDDHPVGHQPGAGRQRLEDLLPRARQRRHAGPGGREVHQGHASRPTRSFVIDDASEYGKGLADIVRKDLGAQVVGTDTHPAEADRLRRRPSPRSRPPAPTRCSSAATTPRPAADQAAARRRLEGHLRGRPTASRTTASSTAPESAAEGTIITCPCLPPDAAPEFAAAYKKAYNADPATYSGRGLRLRQRLARRHRRRQGPRASMLDFVKSYDKQGVTKQMKFDAKGESAEIHGLRLQGRGRQDRRRSARSSSTDATALAPGGGRGTASDRICCSLDRASGAQRPARPAGGHGRCSTCSTTSSR